MVRALLSLVAKLARVPLAPVPVFPYSPKRTFAVLGVLVLHTSQPALLITLPRTVFWKTTRAYCDQGRPRYVEPAAAVEEPDVETDDLLIT